MLGAATNTINCSPANKKKKPQISPLRYAPPDFLWNLMALMYFVLLSVTKAAYATCPAKRGRKSGSGRDDNSVAATIL
jgi:hypothetical protein